MSIERPSKTFELYLCESGRGVAFAKLICYPRCMFMKLRCSLGDRHSRGLFLLAASLIFTLALAHADQPEPQLGSELTQLDLALELKDGQRVRVVNPYGNVRLRALPDAAEGELRVTVQTASGVSNPARIVLHQIEDGIELVIEGDAPLRDTEGFLRADFVLGLPNRVRLDVQMERGDFTMHPFDAPIRLRAEGGTIRLRTTGEVDVEVLSGHVVYQPGGEASIAGGRIQTSSAPVDVMLKRPERLNFEVVSGAAVTTDSIAILARRTRDGRTLRFLDDPAAGLIRIQTDDAPVRLVAEGIR